MTGRDRSILRAVAVGRAQLAPHIPAPTGERVLAILTDAGRAALDDALAGAA